MKGVVFTEFQQMVEAGFGIEMFDKIACVCELESGAAYTAVGTYDHNELLALVTQLSKETGMPVSDLVKAFGHHFFAAIVKSYGHMLNGIDSSIELLSQVENHIHVEVRKLYPGAELPRFEFEQVDESHWHLDYSSARPFADLAEGLIEAAAKHYDDPLVIEREDRNMDEGYAARFSLTMQNLHT